MNIPKKESIRWVDWVPKEVWQDLHQFEKDYLILIQEKMDKLKRGYTVK